MNGGWNILVTESAGFSERAAEILRSLGEVTFADLEAGRLCDAPISAQILFIRLRHHWTAAELARFPHLRVLVTPTTGLNHIDLSAAAQRNIRIISLRGDFEFLADVRATAEHTLALALALLRNVPAASAHTLEGHWNRDLFKGSELYGKTAGIVGYGRLGRIVARYFAAFGMRVLATDPQVNQAELEVPVTLLPLPDLLRQAEIVSLHVNFVEGNRQFFGREAFAAMKPGAWLINTSRGELVEETALLDALQSGRLRGAAVDVIGNEYDVAASPLLAYARNHPNLLVTPHIGGCTFESMEKAEVRMAERLLTALTEGLEKEGADDRHAVLR